MSRYRSTPLEGARRGAAGKPQVFPEDRICADPQCETKLSRYNANRHCFVHAAPAPPRRGERGQRR